MTEYRYGKTEGVLGPRHEVDSVWNRAISRYAEDFQIDPREVVEQALTVFMRQAERADMVLQTFVEEGHVGEPNPED